MKVEYFSDKAKIIINDIEFSFPNTPSNVEIQLLGDEDEGVLIPITSNLNITIYENDDKVNIKFNLKTLELTDTVLQIKFSNVEIKSNYMIINDLLLQWNRMTISYIGNNNFELIFTNIDSEIIVQKIQNTTIPLDSVVDNIQPLTLQSIESEELFNIMSIPVNTNIPVEGILPEFTINVNAFTMQGIPVLPAGITTFIITGTVGYNESFIRRINNKGILGPREILNSPYTVKESDDTNTFDGWALIEAYHTVTINDIFSFKAGIDTINVSNIIYNYDDITQF